MDGMIDKSLSSYRIGKLLGQGGMGSVHEALDTSTGQVVAIKALRSGDMNSATNLTRFQREVEVASSIASPHVAAHLGAGVDPATGAPFMVMERLEGEDLQQLLRRVGSLAPDVALRIAAQVLRGLMKAHEKGVIHRDIKPANLFLARQPDGGVVVKILDFGIAKISLEQCQRVEGGLTRTGSLLGSPQYMAPEQVRMARHADQRADLWSLGVVLYHLLSGHIPHEELDTFGDLIIAICTESPLPVEDVAPWIRPEVAALVTRALEIDPAQRFQSAAEMLEAIEALIPEGADLDPSMLVSRTEIEGAAASAVRRVHPDAETVVGSAAKEASRSWWRAPWRLLKAV